MGKELFGRASYSQVYLSFVMSEFLYVFFDGMSFWCNLIQGVGYLVLQHFRSRYSAVGTLTQKKSSGHRKC